MDARITLLRAVCVCVLAGILVAGLYPFHAPRNDVRWSSDGNGLLFGKHGSIVAASPLQANALTGDGSCSLEILLQPSRLDGYGMILAFYWPERRVAAFSLRQYREGLVLENKSPDEAKESAIYIGDVFHGSKPALVTITSSKAGLAVYVDGSLVRSAPHFPLSNRDLSGQFVIGGSPTTPYNWSGLLKGLSIYDRELSAAEISLKFLDRDFRDPNVRDRKSGGQPGSASTDGVVARYLFDEGKGNIVHNGVDPATNLLIPKRFFVLHAQFLERPWDEFHLSWAYLKDLVVNVGGFIPLGFFFYAYFSLIRNSEHSAAVTIALGFAVSLTIEVLQSFLPTRDSGMTDLFTNTLGTALGVMAFRHKSIQAWLVDSKGRRSDGEFAAGRRATSQRT
jgi:hypothetical protein